MARNDVEQIIIRPMCRLYLPPRHLRSYDPDNPDVKEEALGEYADALARYDRDTLERVWEKVRSEHEFSIWPTPAKFVQAAEMLLPKPRPPSELDVKRKQAWEQAEEYAGRFMGRRQVAKLAKQEGWVGPLSTYVRAAAWMQAQLIADLGRDGISIPSELLKAEDVESAQEGLLVLKRRFAKQVVAGEIDVKVPAALIEKWRADAQQHPVTPSPELLAIFERLQQSVDAGKDSKGRY